MNTAHRTGTIVGPSLRVPPRGRTGGGGLWDIWGQYIVNQPDSACVPVRCARRGSAVCPRLENSAMRAFRRPSVLASLVCCGALAAGAVAWLVGCGSGGSGWDVLGGLPFGVRVAGGGGSGGPGNTNSSNGGGGSG